MNAENKTDFLVALEYFPAGVPPVSLFQMNLEDMGEIVEKFNDRTALNSAAELCLIGLASYFEAFCKNQFAAIINLCPELIKSFVAKRNELTLPITDLLDFDFNIKSHIGFLLAEKHDFGSANQINSLFHDLLLCTPFSATDKAKYVKFLSDRNLLVHHHGIFTHNYSKQHIKREVGSGGRIFYDSLVVKKADYLEHAKFIEAMVKKISDSTHSKLSKTIQENKWELSESAKQALNLLNSFQE